jgi:4-hydroxybenzoate polyprenyltransferase
MSMDMQQRVIFLPPFWFCRETRRAVLVIVGILSTLLWCPSHALYQGLLKVGDEGVRAVSTRSIASTTQHHQLRSDYGHRRSTSSLSFSLTSTTISHVQSLLRSNNQHLQFRNTKTHYNFSTRLEEEEEEVTNHSMPSSDKCRTRRRIITTTLHEYVDVIRPITILQAVGGFLVGYLVLLRSYTIGSIGTGGLSNSVPLRRVAVVVASALVSVYLSYGAGMLMNDLIDQGTDAQHDSKRQRAIASGRISLPAGWNYCGVLCATSVLLGFQVGSGSLSSSYLAWTLSNLILMMGYAFGLQKVLLVKNAVCGWLAISPLLGAVCLWQPVGGNMASSSVAGKSLLRLAAIGFPLQVAREILKDIEDVNVDRGIKSTLPLLVGERLAHRLAFGIVAAVWSVLLFTPMYWRLFWWGGSTPGCSRFPIVYPLSVAFALPMCIRASIVPLNQGQRLLKQSIFVLLAGMIGSLSLQ